MRDLSRWAGYEFRDFDSLGDFIASDLSAPTLVGVLQEGAQFDFLAELHPNSGVLLFFFQGSVDRERAPLLPNFTGVSFLREAKISKVYLSDPSLYLDPNLRLGKLCISGRHAC